MNIRTLALVAAALSTSLGIGAVAAPRCSAASRFAATADRVTASAPTPCASPRAVSVAELQALDAASSKDVAAEKTSSLDGDDVAPFSEGTSFRAATFFDSGRATTPNLAGDVGPTQILVAVTGRLRVFDKVGNVGDLDIQSKTLWDPTGYDYGYQYQVRFDATSNRWFVFAIYDFGFGLAVSDGPEITSRTDFTVYTFRPGTVGEPGNLDVDGFPYWGTMNVDANAVYIAANIYRYNPQTDGTSFFVIRKRSVLDGAPLVATAFRIAGTDGIVLNGPVAVGNDDPNATEGYFVSADYTTLDRLRVFRIADPGGTPRLDADSAVTVPSYYPHGSSTIALLGSLKPIAAGIQRLREARVSRDPVSGVATLWTSQTVPVSSSGAADVFADRSGVRWYQLGGLSSEPTLLQSGTIYDASATSPRGYATPSVAPTGQGHAVFGFSGGSAATHSQIYVATRLAGDAAGTTRGPEVALTSDVTYNPYNSNQNATVQEWGSFSTTTVDGGDGMTAWTFQPYVEGTDGWAVRVLEIKAPSPAAVASLAPSSLPLGATSEVVVSGVSTNGTGYFDPDEGRARRLSASVGGEGVTVESVRFVDPTHVALTIAVADDASTGARDVTITNPDGQSVTATAALAVGPSVSSVRVATSASGASQLVISGTGLVAASTVSIDGVAFAKAPKLKNGSLVQKGKLVSGLSIDRAIPKGATVEIEVSSGGGTTRFSFTRPT